MALSFVDTEAVGVTNSAQITMTFSASLAADDLVVVGAATGDDDNAAIDEAMTTTGYTQLFNVTATAETQDMHFGAFYKKMGATPDTTAVVAASGAGTDAGHAAACTVWRGADTTTPIDVATPAPASTTGTAEPAPPDITTVTANTVIVSFAGVAGQSDITVTPPTGYSNMQVVAATDTVNQDIAVATIAFVGPGLHQPTDWADFSPVAGNQGYAASIAIRPATAPAGRIFKLAGSGGGLVGRRYGLAA